MKKKLVASLMIASIILPNVAGVIVTADDTDTQIQQKDQQISQIQSQQDKAQAEVEALQKKVDAISTQQKELETENEKLTKESKELAKEISTLSEDIVARDQALAEQARSAQTDGSATSYISTILDSKDIVDAVSRVNAMREIVSANNEMLEKQKADKEKLAKKQQENQEAINTVWNNKEKLAASAKELTTQQAALKVAQLNLEAEKTTVQSEKQNC
ncbi:Secreted antigen GbpB/SagA/PcsB, putative peptidoglycan hydrolase [Streptococcus sp. DD13]|nr:Secreted antigen GbpB/SagA/PcsB, putative peptidoglycan hydrolase [Streptococcus sp. DD13]